MIGIKKGPFMASSDNFKIIIYGKSSHGAMPHEGIDAIATAADFIHGIQHFCLCSHKSTCSGAPIRDPEGNIIGAIDLTGDFFNVNSHTLGMAVAISEGYPSISISFAVFFLFIFNVDVDFCFCCVLGSYE